MPASLSASTHDPAPAQAPRAPLARGRRPRCADALRTRGRSQAAARYHGPVRPRQPATGTAVVAARYGRGGRGGGLRLPQRSTHTSPYGRRVDLDTLSLGHAIALLDTLSLSSSSSSISLPLYPPSHPHTRAPRVAGRRRRRILRSSPAESGAGDVQRAARGTCRLAALDEHVFAHGGERLPAATARRCQSMRRQPDGYASRRAAVYRPVSTGRSLSASSRFQYIFSRISLLVYLFAYIPYIFRRSRR